MILRLSEQLDVPLRERNTLLLAGGYAPAYPEHSLDEPELARLRVALRQILTGHQPYPALVVNRWWEMLDGNAAVAVLTAGCDPALLAPPVNALRASLWVRRLTSRSPRWRSSPSIPPTRKPPKRCTHMEGELVTDNAATEMIHAQVPLCATLGITADTFRPGEVVLSLDWAPNLCTGNGVLHGGIVMALADSAGGLCAFLNLPAGAGGTATIESKTNFLRPLTMRAGTAREGSGPSAPATRCGTLKAHCRPLHVGKRVIVLETEVRGDDEKLAAKVLQTQAVL